MRAAGFAPEDYAAEDPVEVWPENWTSWVLFMSVRGQWVYGPTGPLALNYAALYPLLDRRCPDPDEWDATFHDIQVLEDAALQQIHKEAQAR